IVCALLAAMPNLIGCESSRSYDYQFEKQVKRAQECRQLQDKLVGDQPLTPERGEEIANTMAGGGCTARLPAADAGVPSRFSAKRWLRACSMNSRAVGMQLPREKKPTPLCRCACQSGRTMRSCDHRYADQSHRSDATEAASTAAAKRSRAPLDLNT